MIVKDLIEQLKKLNPEATVIPQVVAKDGSAWMMAIGVNEINPDLIQIAINHPMLKSVSPTVVIENE